jgi:hypothetical protein
VDTGTYYYRITAYNSGGAGPESDTREVAVTAMEIPPGGALIPVGSPAELAAIIGDITDPGKNYSANAYVLTADIDLGGYGHWTPIGKIGSVDYNGNPTGGLEPFKGYFYGRGHRILNFQLPVSGGHNKIGLFGYTEGARIRDLVVELAAGTVTLSSSTNALNVAGIVAWAEDTHIVDCGVYSTGTITINGAVMRALGIGGIVSVFKSGTISGCYVSLNLAATAATTNLTHLNIGGIVDSAQDSFIENCYFAGNLGVSNTGSNNFSQLGGIIAVSANTNIENCYAAGTLSNSNGGPSYSATGGISSVANISVGNSAALQSAVSDNSNRLGRVQNNQTTGTLAVVLTNNYAFSGMTLNGSSVTDDATAPQNSRNGLGKTAAQLKQRSTYETGLGWDFTNVWDMGPANYPYPILKWMNGVVPVPEGFMVISD